MIKAQPLVLPGIAHGFFTREGGHSTGIFSSLNCGLGSGDVEVVKANRHDVAFNMGVAPSHLVSAYQVHSAAVAVVDKPFVERPKCDGLVCNVRGLALGILTADCGPILFADHAAGVIGACHAGWKGALTGVADNTILAMENLGADRKNIVAVLGPTISKTNYEVGPDFPNPFLEQNSQHQKYFTPSVNSRHYMFDLPAYLVDRLKGQAIAAVHDLALCTYADQKRFFSYRRTTHLGEQDYGRLISTIVLSE
jgi:polyphenol oxidase